MEVDGRSPISVSRGLPASVPQRIFELLGEALRLKNLDDSVIGRCIRFCLGGWINHSVVWRAGPTLQWAQLQ